MEMQSSARLWVERTEMWSSHRMDEFVARRRGAVVEGPNPGYLYVMRSGAHALDMYKIGKTRRSPDVRAQELARGTGVPTRFDVLASWEVGDIDNTEREVHESLAPYRVSRRREFFRAPLSSIIQKIDEVVARLRNEVAASG